MRLLTWCNLPHGERYEVLQCLAYRQPSRYAVHFLKHGVLVNSHPFATEVAARTAFERFVEDKTGVDYCAAIVMSDDEWDRADAETEARN